MLQRTKLKKIIKDKKLFDDFMNLIKKGKTQREAIKIIIPDKEKIDFYKSLKWKRIRYDVLKESNGRCCLCGRSAKDGIILHVDHIIPISLNWEKRFDKNNLQVLCEDCNIGKLNNDNTNWKQ